MDKKGYEALWGYFGLSRASWVTLPRAFMHEMPDEWQLKMAGLLEQWSDTWDWPDELGIPYVSQRCDGKFKAFPEYVLNYRHPRKKDIESIRRPITSG